MTITPRYREIAGILLGQITDGSLPPGAEVPSERELAEHYEVARMTARAALRELERVGAVTPGRRRLVASHRPVTVHLSRSEDRTWAGESPARGADSWAADILAAGYEPTQEIRVLTRTATPDVAQRLEIPEGAVITVRELVRFADGKPNNLISFAFPLSVAQGTPLELPPSIEGGSVAWLEDKWGQLSQRDELGARPPDEAEATLLGITGGWPLLVVWRTGRTPRRPVMTSWARYPADRTVLVIEQ